MSSHSVRARRALLGVALFTSLAFVDTARAQFFDCDEPLCVRFLDMPAQIHSGDKVDFRVQYRLQKGAYPDGVTIEIDSPDYFVANNLPSTAVWRTYLPGPNSTTTECVIDPGGADPWDVRCGLRSIPQDVGDSAITGTFPVSMYSQPGDPPRGHVARFTVTINGRRVDPDTGDETNPTNAGTADVAFIGEANPYLWPHYPLPIPTNSPDYPGTEGQVGPGPGAGFAYVPDLSNPGHPLQGWAFPLFHQLANRIMPRVAKNDFGDQYDPPLSEVPTFDADFVHPVGGTPGSNTLYDVTYTMVVPPWVRFRAASGMLTTSNMPNLQTPTIGAAGGTISGKLATPFTKAAPITLALYPGALPATVVTASITQTTANTSFLIPCELLAGLDTDPATPFVQLDSARGLFQVTLTGKQRVVNSDGSIGEIVHTVALPAYNPLAYTNVPTTCPGPGALGAGTTAKAGWLNRSSNLDTYWNINFNGITNHFGGYGDFAVIDFIPRYQVLRTTPTGPNDIVGKPWLCKLPESAMPTPIDPSYLGECPETGATYEPAGLPPDFFNPYGTNPNASRVRCSVGVPYDYRWDTDAYFDPLQRDMFVPYGETAPDGKPGLAWNGSYGCMLPDNVCMHPTTRGTYPACTIGSGGKYVRADEISAVIWRSDLAETSSVVGWPPGPLGTSYEPQNSTMMSFSLPVWNLPLDPTPLTEEPRAAWTLNHARFYGGAFDHDNDPGTAALVLGEGALGWKPMPYNRLLIDNRITLGPSLATADNTIPEGDRVWINSAVTVTGNGTQSASGFKAHFDLPPGFDPAPNTPYAGAVSRPLVVPPNPVGLSGPLNGAYLMHFAGWVAPGPTRHDDVSVELVWVPDGGGHWRYVFTTHVPSRGYGSYVNQVGIAVSVTPRVDYLFLAASPNPLRLSVTIDGFDRTDDAGHEPYPTDADDWVTTTLNLFVPAFPELEAIATPTCLPGRASPSFFVDYLNTSGVHQYGVQIVFKIPEPVGGLPLVFDGFYEESGWAPTNTDHVVEVAMGPRDLSGPVTWVPLTPAIDKAAVTLVRIAFGAATSNIRNRVPGDYVGGRYRVDLVHPAATLADLGKAYSTDIYPGSIEAGITISDPSTPFAIGSCPLPLVVDKWLDRDRDGTRDDDEPALPGVAFAGTRTGGLAAVSRVAQAATTDATGRVTFEVFPGQVATVAETLPAAIAAPIAGYPDHGATLTWAATNGPTTRVSPTIGFEVPTPIVFGNMCTCDHDNLCIETAACDVAIGTDTFGASCNFEERTLTCDPAEADLCEVATGACDPATGACGITARTCDEGAPMAIYVTVDDDQGPIGVARCWLTPGSDVITCDTRDEGGVEVLDVQLELVCGDSEDDQ